MSASLIYPREPALFRLAVVFSTLCWVGFVAGTLGIGLLVLGVVFLAYLFAQSGFIAYVRGNGVRVSGEQLPDLYSRFLECCQRVGVEQIPEIYVLNAHGMLNALATRFLRRHYVILYSDVLDALAEHPESLDFYLGHELGHVERRHLRWAAYLTPAALIPLLGTAYSRAREYSCDLYGLACCDDPKDAAYGLAVLAAGENSLDQLDLSRFASQSSDTGGFWMSYHELTADYPWLAKRVYRVMAAAANKPVRFPSRHALAWPVALLVPRTGLAAGGGLAGMMVTVAIVGVLAAIAVPNFVAFQMKAKMAPVSTLREQVQAAGDAYIFEHQAMPPSLAAMGLPEDLSNQAVASVEIGQESVVLALVSALRDNGAGQVVLTPYIENGELLWDCSGDLAPQLLASACGGAPPAEAAPAEAHAAPAARLEPNAETCSAEFRSSPTYAALLDASQDRLREACNLWKLQQLEH